MANWSALITGKEITDAEGTLLITYDIIRDKETVVKEVRAKGRPSEIQQVIGDNVKAYAPQWEIADSIKVGDVLNIIVDGSETVVEEDVK